MISFESIASEKLLALCASSLRDFRFDGIRFAVLFPKESRKA